MNTRASNSLIAVATVAWLSMAASSPAWASEDLYEMDYDKRDGIAVGLAAGIGLMEDDAGPIECAGCIYKPIAGAGSFHIGGMVNERVAILFEVWTHGQTLSGDASRGVFQTLLTGAAQVWVSDVVWLKLGAGVANLTLAASEGAYPGTQFGYGAGMFGAGGVELVHKTNFALDLQLRSGAGFYGTEHDRVSALTGGLGLSWY